MKKNVTRRDFCNGVIIGTGVNALSPMHLFGQSDLLTHELGESFSNYPPMLNGMRGSHQGSFEVAHALAWTGEKPTAYKQHDQEYDLVVVGAGISGLATAHFYQQKMGQDARILLLDNHDDFGGHAKRNEFNHDGRLLLGIGGSVNLENPRDYSEEAKGLLHDLGIDLDAMKNNEIDGFESLTSTNAQSVLALPGPNGHVTVKANWMSLNQGEGDIETAVKLLPLPVIEQDKLIEFLSGGRDYLDDLSLRESYRYVQSVSYEDFLSDRVGLDDETSSIFYAFMKLIWGIGGKNISVMGAISTGAPGMQGMGRLAKFLQKILLRSMSGGESLYFPDGNASIPRLLVKKLIPAVTSGDANFNNISTSYFDYKMLDRSEHSVRLRLNSTVVGVRQKEDDRVEVDYVKEGKALRVTGKHSILACYNNMIPHLCPELPESQKDGLRYGEKVPLVWANIHLEDGIAFSELGVDRIDCPKDPFVVVTTPPFTTTGGYQPPKKTSDPMVVFMMSIPEVKATGKETARELYKAGRHVVYSTSFSTYEQQIRDQLQALLGPHGFNHEIDIKAITVNRWPHGYAYEYSSLDDPEWEEGKAPHEIGRAQFGKISIANSDSEAYAYVNA
ncbi:MAG: NAD(P)-binding protein, partial [Paracoccaceae bacterium]|nr:NAD(P)-binding protein [Paracoccaceae bacterium]